MAGNDKMPMPFVGGLLLAGIAVIALFSYAMSLRAENERLAAQVAALSGGAETEGEVDAAPESEGEVVDQDEGARMIRDGEDLVVELDEPVLAAEPDSVSVSDFTLGPTERSTLTTQLGFVPSGGDRRVFITVTYGDASAAAFASALGRVFAEAGFDVQPTRVARFPIRPGIYFMAADEEPPETVNAIQSALEATGWQVTAGLGYREFYRAKKAEDPSWNGFDMSADQEFVIAIGRDG